MMKFNKIITTGLLGMVLLVSCGPDDGDITPERDRGEQAELDEIALQDFMETHFYNYEEFENPAADFDYRVRFDTIAGENADRIPISQSPFLESKSVTRNNINYNIYILKIREGEGQRPTFADSTFVGYDGQLLNVESFDSAHNPTWFNLPSVVAGFAEGITEFKGSTGFTVNPDNSVDWNNDFGVGAILMPSGLGYFSTPPATSAIPMYSPLIFSVELYAVNEADHDEDGIPSYMEDIDEDGILGNDFDDDTDEDFILNYQDKDDDGDGTPTREEIVIEQDGTLVFPDTDGDGKPDYLDKDTF